MKKYLKIGSKAKGKQTNKILPLKEWTCDIINSNTHMFTPFYLVNEKEDYK